MEREELERVIEAVLFAAGEPVAAQRIALAAGCGEDKLRAAVRHRVGIVREPAPPGGEQEHAAARQGDEGRSFRRHILQHGAGGADIQRPAGDGIQKFNERARREIVGSLQGGEQMKLICGCESELWHGISPFG